MTAPSGRPVAEICAVNRYRPRVTVPDVVIRQRVTALAASMYAAGQPAMRQEARLAARAGGAPCG